MNQKDIDALPHSVVVRCCVGKICTTTVSPRPCVQMLPDGEYVVGVEYARDTNGNCFKVFLSAAEAAAWVATAAIEETE